MGNGPHFGIKVVEIAGTGPAPVAGMMLADMGAEVVVVERRNPNANAANIASSTDAGGAGHHLHLVVDALGGFIACAGTPHALDVDH